MSVLSEKFKKVEENKLLTFSKPYMDFIGKGSIFGLVYIIMAVANLVIPFVVLYTVIDSGFFKGTPAKYIFAFIFTWLVIIFACWIGIQIWLDRRKKVSLVGSSEFVATPMVSDILQTFGEWLGTFVGIIGAGGGLIAFIFLGNEARYLFSTIGLGSIYKGALTILYGPILGFFIIIVSRYLAELLRIFAALANNTKEIALNIKNK